MPSPPATEAPSREVQTVWVDTPAQRWHKPVFIAFLVCFAAGMVMQLLRIELPHDLQWAAGLLPLLAAATSLIGLARRLPVQNVAMVAALMALAAGGVTAIAIETGLPFGSVRYTRNVGGRLFGAVPWVLPLLWIFVLINARGVARLILRPWRKTTYYGFWVLGLAATLAVLFDLALEPFATRVIGGWVWESPPGTPAWHSAPWVNFLGWLVTALLILAFSTPWLINKQPVKQPTDYHPLVLWLLAQLFLATGNALHGLWTAAAAGLAGAGVVVFFAVRGARW